VLIVSAAELVRDRQVLRALLTVKRNDEVLHVDRVNLASFSSRRRMIDLLKAKQIILPDEALLALEQACRTPPAAQSTPERTAVDRYYCDAPALDLAGLWAVFDKWLLIKDRAYLPIFVGAVLAHQLGGAAVWLLIVGPPGSAKTESLLALFGYPGIYPMSSLTPRTLASGLEKPGGEPPSLLAKLTNEILAVKDLTTILEARREDRQAILGQLREISDGSFDMPFGTGQKVTWRGRLGFLAGVTPIIDKHQRAMAVCGERFVLLRPVLPDDEALSLRALDGEGREAEMRVALATAMHGFLGARHLLEPAVSQEVKSYIGAVGRLITRARSPVQRAGYGREIESDPTPESPTRFPKTLLALAKGIAVAHDSKSVTHRELRMVVRVAFDCLPPTRRQVLAALADLEADDLLTTSDVAATMRISRTVVRRTLQDLHALRVLLRKREDWQLQPQWHMVLSQLRKDLGVGLGTGSNFSGTDFDGHQTSSNSNDGAATEDDH
jgi:hypothetical protein